jgi:hypothetical protein
LLASVHGSGRRARTFQRGCGARRGLVRYFGTAEVDVASSHATVGEIVVIGRLVLVLGLRVE